MLSPLSLRGAPGRQSWMARKRANWTRLCARTSHRGPGRREDVWFVLGPEEAPPEQLAKSIWETPPKAPFPRPLTCRPPPSAVTTKGPKTPPLPVPSKAHAGEEEERARTCTLPSHGQTLPRTPWNLAPLPGEQRPPRWLSRSVQRPVALQSPPTPGPGACFCRAPASPEASRHRSSQAPGCWGGTAELPSSGHVYLATG